MPLLIPLFLITVNIKDDKTMNKTHNKSFKWTVKDRRHLIKSLAVASQGKPMGIQPKRHLTFLKPLLSGTAALVALAAGLIAILRSSEEKQRRGHLD